MTIPITMQIRHKTAAGITIALIKKDDDERVEVVSAVMLKATSVEVLKYDGEVLGIPLVIRVDTVEIACLMAVEALVLV